PRRNSIIPSNPRAGDAQRRAKCDKAHPARRPIEVGCFPSRYDNDLPLHQTMRLSIALAAGLAALLHSFSALALEASPPAGSRTPAAAKSQAQALVERTTARHHELTSLELHATPPDGAQSAVIASMHADRLGSATAPEDQQVLQSGTARVHFDGEKDVQVALP